MPPKPSLDDSVPKYEIIDAGNYRIFSEIEPDTLSLLDTDRRLGLFWINDFDELPWLRHLFSNQFERDQRETLAPPHEHLGRLDSGLVMSPSHLVWSRSIG